MPDYDSDLFVELNRRFRRLEQKAKADETAFESYTAVLFDRDNTFNWDDLLKENRVIILGEPGSGKSWELRERAKLLADHGLSAFFVRLDQLIDRDLRTLLNAEAHARLVKWLKFTN